MNKIIKLISLSILVLCSVKIHQIYGQAEKGNIILEKYVPRAIIEKKFGTGMDEFGFAMLEGDITPIHTKIEVDNKGNIYVLDKVNNRVQKFNKEGKLLFNIPVQSFQRKWYYDDNEMPIPGSIEIYNPDIAVDTFGNLYVLTVPKEGKREVEIYKDGKILHKKLTINKEKISGIFIDEFNNLYIKENSEKKQKKMFKVEISGKVEIYTGGQKSRSGYIFYPAEIINGDKWIIPFEDKDSKRKILLIGSTKEILSAKFLKTDKIGNIYIYTYQYDGHYYIYKYSSEFNLLAKVKGYEGTKNIFFRSPMIVDNEGNIYQLVVEGYSLYNEEHPDNVMKIIKWEKKK